MKNLFSQRNLVTFSRKRVFTDSVSWILYYLLNLGFITIYFWHKSTKTEEHPFTNLVSWVTQSETGTWSEAFFTILQDGLVLTLFLMIIVYINITVFKRILDSRYQQVIKYVTYLFVVGVTASLFALLFKKMTVTFELTRFAFGFPTNLLIIFSGCLISTGLIYLREYNIRDRDLKKQEIRNKTLRKKLERTSEKLQEFELSVSSDHIKIGSKNRFVIVLFDDIILFKGDGNEPKIYTADGKSYMGTTSMTQYESLLPSTKFLRVHRSYIINKDKVSGKQKNKLILSQLDMEVPIGETYVDIVNQDSRLGWSENA